MKRQLTVAEKHQLKIARQTLRMADAAVAMLNLATPNSPTKAEARDIIKRLTGKAAR